MPKSCCRGGGPHSNPSLRGARRSSKAGKGSGHPAAIGPSVEAHDLDPVSSFSGGVLVQELERACGLVDGVHGNRVRFFAGGDEEPAFRIDGKSTWLTLGGRARQVGKLDTGAIDTEHADRVAGALRDA